MSDEAPDFPEVAAAAEKDREEAFAVWRARPPIDRIETWYEATHESAIGLAFMELGAALRDWAREQKAK